LKGHWQYISNGLQQAIIHVNRHLSPFEIEAFIAGRTTRSIQRVLRLWLWIDFECGAGGAESLFAFDHTGFFSHQMCASVKMYIIGCIDKKSDIYVDDIPEVL
jgi:hypothetical protein